jgi:SNF family Na+-dependent transporter
MTEKTIETKREHWGTRIGLILAMAGNAVGLGNFLRFPSKAAANGGGAFMVPYFIAFILLGIPLMWIEWGIGRFGGTLGHGTLPGVMHKIFRNKWVKYLGVLGMILPLFVAVYYCYIESWTMAFSWFSIRGDYIRIEGKDLPAKRSEMGRFFKEFTGMRPTVKVPATLPPGEMGKVQQYTDANQVPEEFLAPAVPEKKASQIPEVGTPTVAAIAVKEVELKAKYFDSNSTAYIFFLITFLINFYFLYRGLSAGIEQLGKIGMPILFAFAVILALRVITLGRPDGSEWSVADGFNFLWVPKFDRLGSASVWLAAAGQVFFTLSLGLGAIQAYASYLSAKDDIVLTGLTTASLNEFAEVVLGGTIAIPAAVAFFGPEMTVSIAQGGTFDLGFQSLPMIFSQIPMGWFFGAIWFGLLFIAGITSSVALLTPPITFLKDELKFSHVKAVILVTGMCFLLAHGPIFFIGQGVIDEIDYWAGTFGLVFVALLEVIMFMWVFGSERAWLEIHRGCDLKIPRFFLYIMKYVTPLYILAIFLVWGIQDGWPTLVMANVPLANRPVIWWTRVLMWAVIGLFVYFIWERFRDEDQESWMIPGCVWGVPALVLVALYPGLLPIETNALLMMVLSWGLAVGLSGYCIYRLLGIPAQKHQDFVEDCPEE